MTLGEAYKAWASCRRPPETYDDLRRWNKAIDAYQLATARDFGPARGRAQRRRQYYRRLEDLRKACWAPIPRGSLKQPARQPLAPLVDIEIPPGFEKTLSTIFEASR